MSLSMQIEIPEKIDLKDNIVYLYEVMHQILTARKERQVLTMRYWTVWPAERHTAETAAILGFQIPMSRIRKNSGSEITESL